MTPLRCGLNFARDIKPFSRLCALLQFLGVAKSVPRSWPR